MSRLDVTPGTRASETRIRHCVVALALVSACHRPAPQGNNSPARSRDLGGALSEADTAAIRATSAKWMNAARAGQWAEVANTYTEDAVIWFPDRTVVGRPAILAAFQAMAPMTTMDLIITEIEGRGDMAFVSGYSTAPGADGSRIRRGKYVDIRKRQPDGTWLFYRDMVNTPDR